jgi:hypothetical protein
VPTPRDGNESSVHLFAKLLGLSIVAVEKLVVTKWNGQTALATGLNETPFQYTPLPEPDPPPSFIYISTDWTSPGDVSEADPPKLVIELYA